MSSTNSGRRLHTLEEVQAVLWRMAHRKTGGGRGGEHSEVTDNFASLVFDDSKIPPEYGRVFLELLPRNF